MWNIVSAASTAPSTAAELGARHLQRIVSTNNRVMKLVTAKTSRNSTTGEAYRPMISPVAGFSIDRLTMEDEVSGSVGVEQSWLASAEGSHQIVLVCHALIRHAMLK